MSLPASPSDDAVQAVQASDDEFNNRKAIADSAVWLQGWEERSASLYAEWPRVVKDIPYGGHSSQAFDVFLAEPSAPDAHAAAAATVIYVHGGYWQWNHRRQQAFVARALLEQGVNVAFIGYRLAPEVGMADIVADVRSAVSAVLSWQAEQAGPGAGAAGAYLVGASSGSQLAACAMDLPGVRGALLMQGLYDLAPLRGTYIDAALSLSDEDIRRYSPALQAGETCPPVVLAVGSAELPRLRNASVDRYLQLASGGVKAGLVVAAGHHHFSLLDELARTDGLLLAALLSLMRCRQASSIPA